MISLMRYYHPELGIHFGCQIGETVYDLTHRFSSLAQWLEASRGRVSEAITELPELAAQIGPGIPVDLLNQAPVSTNLHWQAPVDDQEIWAAGVTYERSRDARQEEATDGGDIYARVYEAGRPELFFKAAGKNVIGPGGSVGIRRDASWSVPEPELVVAFNPDLEAVGFTIGNDLSSRDIEGENPLYLPQAKIYTASCALGPRLVLQAAKEWPMISIRMEIERNNNVVFSGEVHTSRMRRSLEELATYLGRCNHFPGGVFLLTGTGIVPPADFTLHPGDRVDITIEGIGTLSNPVERV